MSASTDKQLADFEAALKILRQRQERARAEDLRIEINLTADDLPGADELSDHEELVYLLGNLV